MNFKTVFSLLVGVSLLGLSSTGLNAQTKKTLVRLNYSGSIYATTSVVGL